MPACSRSPASLYTRPFFRLRKLLMKTAEVRRAYLSFFEARGHRVAPSSPLVPQGDPTLLFANAGMNQFKDALLGREDLGFKRAASAQKCVRAGGKHNDLENVGYTARHLTFFEMLGNFSFGDYFKEDSIAWAWEFATDTLGLPPQRLWATVHPSDEESRSLWIKLAGLPPERVVDHADNFWAMGDTGPCGPCTELFYDHGPEIPGGPPGSPEEDGDRYIEFWNLVFPQFDRAPDGALEPLPRPGVDTGMGLERMATVLQGVHSNFEIDLFRGLMQRAAEFAGIRARREALANPSLRVIADHLRSSVFLVADGVAPGNEDRAYVLRRIIRRALRHGHKLRISGPFFHRLAEVLTAEMGDAYPELIERQAHVQAVLAREEERFSETLKQGMEVLEKAIANLQGKALPGDLIFKLYDTYGFPADLSADVARERGLAADMDGFEAAMRQQQDRGRASSRFGFALAQKIPADSKVQFLGYETCAAQAKVIGLHDFEGGRLASLQAGGEAVVLLDRTPFYAEAGGQVGDTGILEGEGFRFQVRDTQKSGDQHLHLGQLDEGELKPGAGANARVDAGRRQRIRSNHSATHLLNAALRKVLGPHVRQMGSLVDADHLRFDFSHPQPVSEDELGRIEGLINAQIQANGEVSVTHASYDDAIAQGALAMFGEKYGDRVRVLAMGGDYSVELCGGTHVDRTGDIGLCKITGESAIAAGTRRIEAVSGPTALARIAALEGTLRQLAETLQSGPRDLADRAQSLMQENRRLEREVRDLKQRLAADLGAELARSAQEINGIKVVAAEVPGDAKAMMQTLDALRSRLNPAVIALGQAKGDKASLVVGLSKELTGRMQAPELIRLIGAMVEAKGGGSPIMARAGGGNRPEKLAEALGQVAAWVRERSGEQGP